MSRKKKPTKERKEFVKEAAPRPYEVHLTIGDGIHPTLTLTRKAGWRILEYWPNREYTHPYPGDGVPHWYPHEISKKLIQQNEYKTQEFEIMFAEVRHRVALGCLPQSAVDGIKEMLARAEADANVRGAAA